mmetsp:Transcript_27830/g.64663  ORF Transcript_27830/g.64663 Transcript_27830/m.64663 type:complete len:663 (-) Transcript_27830:72-2060(-)
MVDSSLLLEAATATALSQQQWQQLPPSLLQDLREALRKDWHVEISRACAALQHEMQGELRKLELKLQEARQDEAAPFLPSSKSQWSTEPQEQQLEKLSSQLDVLTSQVLGLQSGLQKQESIQESRCKQLEEFAQAKLQTVQSDSAACSKQLRMDLDRECRAAGLDLFAHLEQRVAGMVQEATAQTEAGLQDFHRQLSSAFDSAGQVCHSTQAQVQEIESRVSTELQTMRQQLEHFKLSFDKEAADLRALCANSETKALEAVALADDLRKGGHMQASNGEALSMVEASLPSVALVEVTEHGEDAAEEKEEVSQELPTVQTWEAGPSLANREVAEKRSPPRRSTDSEEGEVTEVDHLNALSALRACGLALRRASRSSPTGRARKSASRAAEVDVRSAGSLRSTAVDVQEMPEQWGFFDDEEDEEQAIHAAGRGSSSDDDDDSEEENITPTASAARNCMAPSRSQSASSLTSGLQGSLARPRSSLQPQMVSKPPMLQRRATAPVQSSQLPGSAMAMTPSRSSKSLASARQDDFGGSMSSRASLHRKSLDMAAARVAMVISGDVSCTVYVPRFHPVMALKESIALKSSVPPHQQILRLGARRLYDHELLADVLPDERRATIGLIRTCHAPGSWHCQQCEAVNYRGRSNCKECSTAKPEIPPWRSVK